MWEFIVCIKYFQYAYVQFLVTLLYVFEKYKDPGSYTFRRISDNETILAYFIYPVI